MGCFARLICVLLLIATPLSPVFAEAVDPNTVILDAAGKIIYDDETGTASAEGGAVLSYGDIRIAAERIDYDDASGKVVASSPPGVGVNLSNGEYSLQGEKLEYDIESDEGVLSGAKSSVAVGDTMVYVRGESLEAIPYDTAVKDGLISGKSSIDGQYVVKWDDVSLTTCNLEHPHYRLEAKRFIFTPGRRVIVKKPRLYLGKNYVFTYPFDYVINVSREQRFRSTLLPKLSYSDSRGGGVGITGPITWDSGGVDLSLSYSGKVGFEGEAFIRQEIGNNFYINAGVEYTWDREWDTKIWRPLASLRHEGSRWFTELRWSRNKYIESQKNAEYQYRGTLDTKPEFIIGTHWNQMGSSWYRLLASWGSYRETMLLDRVEFTGEWRSRTKFSVETYGERPGDISPFWGISASTMLYSTGGMRQDIFSFTAGLRYCIGGISAGSAYKRRWVRGESPMLWDLELTEEKVYQKFDFPIGKYLSVGVLGGYDLEASFVEEMNYSLKYENDCTIFEFVYRNDRNEGGDNRFFMRFGLVGTDFGFENEEYLNPFNAPKDLPKQK